MLEKKAGADDMCVNLGESMCVRDGEGRVKGWRSWILNVNEFPHW